MAWGQDDFWKGFQSKQGANALIGLGSGLLQGNTFAKGLAAGGQGFMQGAELDQQYADEAEKKAKEEQGLNSTIEYMRGKGYDDLIAGVESGGMDMGAAWTEALRRGQPQAADPFTLGKGQIRYDGQGNVIAQGPEGGPDTVINNNMGATDAFYEQLDKDLAGQTSEILNSGMNAQSNNIRLTELESLLATAPQGMQGGLTQAVGALGIPTEGLDDVQAAQALISQLVPGQRPPGSGTMSDADLNLFKQSLPAIINQPGGNQKILQTMKAINEYTIAQAQIAQQVANRQISPAEGRARAAQVPNPLAGIQSAPSGGGWTDMGNGIRIRPVGQ